MARHSHWKANLLRAAVIAAAVLWIYLPVIHGMWIWDDKELVSRNPLIHDPAGWWKIWMQPGSLVDFYPLWYSVEWLQWRVWNGNPAGFHAVNLALHFTSALLVWRLLARFGLRLAWIGGLLFAIHPVQVESVAWISELKNTLSLPPFLLAMVAWIDYDTHRRHRDYVQALAFFLMAMLCKTTMAMFPVVILLYAWWKRGRIRLSDLQVSAPFFAISLVLGIVTIWFQQQHAIRGAEIPIDGVGSRIALGATCLAFYFGQCIWPVGLIPIYPQWTIAPPSLVQFLPWFALIGVFAWCWFKRATWGRHILLGLGFFVLNLAPFLGFTNAFYMSFSWVVDHNLYLPIVGLLGLGIAGLETLERRFFQTQRAVFMVPVGIISAMLAVESRSYASVFVSQQALWTYTIEHNPNAWPGLNNLGNVLLDLGKPAEALVDFRKALLLHPHDAQIYNNMGNASLALGQKSEALDAYGESLAINPDYDLAHVNLGILLVSLGRDAEATAEFKKALAINPHSLTAHENLGSLELRTGHPDEAAQEFEAILRDNSHYDEFQKSREKQKSTAETPGDN